MTFVDGAVGLPNRYILVANLAASDKFLGFWHYYKDKDNNYIQVGPGGYTRACQTTVNWQRGCQSKG